LKLKIRDFQKVCISTGVVVEVIIVVEVVGSVKIIVEDDKAFEIVALLL